MGPQFCFAGCFLSTVPSLATTGYDQGEQELVVRDHKLDCGGTERD